MYEAVICVTIITAKVHPRAYGADDISKETICLSSGSSRAYGVDANIIGYLAGVLDVQHGKIGFIPVHTGWILNFLKNLCGYKITNPISNSYGRISMHHLFGMYFCG